VEPPSGRGTMGGVGPPEPEPDGAPREACGVFGVFAPGQPVASLTYLGLHALQHLCQ